MPKRYRLGFLNDINFSFEQTFGDGVGDPVQLVKHALENIRRGQEGQAFLGTTRYRAIVLSEPQVVRKSHDDEGELSKDHFQFRARIPEVHSSLPDPFCYIKSEGPDGTRAKRAIARHPSFVSDDNSEDTATGLQIGDVVVVDFEKGPSNTRSTGGRYIKLARFARFEGYETECDELVNDPPNDWCNFCTFTDPIDCTPIGNASSPMGSGGTTAAYEGAPANVEYGNIAAESELGNTNSDARSGPCAQLYYEDQVGLGVGRPQVSPCCCGQVLKFGTSETGANHDCSGVGAVAGCHMVGGTDNHATLERLRVENPGTTIATGGKLNCATGEYLQFERSPNSLHPLVKDLWLEFLAEVTLVVGSELRWRYSSVRRSVKHQWILFTGRQGLAHRDGSGFDKSHPDHRGIYIPSKPLGSSANANRGYPSGHIWGAACDITFSFPKDGDGRSTNLNVGYNGLTRTELCEKINSEIAGAGSGTSRSTAYVPAQNSPDKFGISWYGPGDPPHWQMFWVYLDANNDAVSPRAGGTPTKIRDLQLTRDLQKVAGKYYYGLHGDNPCNWHEDFVDLPLDYLLEQCPSADEACLAQLGDPWTYKPSMADRYLHIGQPATAGVHAAADADPGDYMFLHDDAGDGATSDVYGTTVEPAGLGRTGGASTSGI